MGRLAGAGPFTNDVSYCFGISDHLPFSAFWTNLQFQNHTTSLTTSEFGQPPPPLFLRYFEWPLMGLHICSMTSGCHLWLLCWFNWPDECQNYVPHPILSYLCHLCLGLSYLCCLCCLCHIGSIGNSMWGDGSLYMFHGVWMSSLTARLVQLTTIMSNRQLGNSIWGDGSLYIFHGV